MLRKMQAARISPHRARTIAPQAKLFPFFTFFVDNIVSKPTSNIPSHCF